MRLLLSSVLRPAATSGVAVEQVDGTRTSSTRVIRGAFALLSAQPVTWATSLATAVLVPRYLGDEELGRWAVAWAIGMMVGTLASVGVPSLLTRTVAVEPARAASYAWAAVAIVTAGSLLVGAGAIAALALARAPIDLLLAAIGIAVALALTVNGILMAVLVGLGRHARYAWSLAAGGTAGTVIGLGVLALGGGAVGYALATLVAWTATSALFWLTSGLPFTRSALDLTFIRQLVVGGLPFLGWNIAIRVRNEIDVVLTGVLIQSSVAGWLAAAYRIINITVFIPAAITMPLLPALSRTKGQPEEYRSVLGESLAAVLLLTVPVSAAIFAVAPVIPTLLGWAESLNNAVPLMMLLAFQQTLVGVDMVLGTSLIALGLERRWLGVAVAGALFNPLLNLLAIPLAASLTGNGAIGAALVELATEVLFMVGAIRLTPRNLLGPENFASAARIVVAGIAMLAITMLLRGYSLALALVLGGVVYVGVAVALGVVGRRHVRVIRAALRLA